MRYILLIGAFLSALFLTGCDAPANEPVASVMSKEMTDKANKMFEEIFMRNVMRSPMFQTYLGIKTDYDKWDDESEAYILEGHELDKLDLSGLEEIIEGELDSNTQVSLRLMRQQLENSIADFKWRFHNYPVNQMHGAHTQIPSFLINQHQVTDLSDANAYISRINGVENFVSQLIENLKIRAKKGIIAPKFVFPHVISASENIISGQPFDKDGDSAIFADFSKKVRALSIKESEKEKLIAQAKESLLTRVKPAYLKLIAYLKTLHKQADARDGIWKLPEGDTYYNVALARTTTTNLTSDEIHKIGLMEVARIHDEMRGIKVKVGFKGNLKDFMGFMKSDKQFYLNDNEVDREKYLQDAVALIDHMKSRLDELFLVKPKADLVVKRVEAFREESAGKAFYERPAPDGSRPGKYYANLYDMKSMPPYQMAALAYHEGIPGHHMQLAIAQELEGIPKFRMFGSYTAYIEGWGLYSEFIPKEMGLYADPYSDFGRLAMELWRACRLVVDTGIHAMKWNRQQGIDYYTDNTPNATADAIKMVERHIVMPSQATAYKIGMLKILELREVAKKKLGDKFDIREFHDVVLKNGAIPLNVLEEFVMQWIESKA